MWYTISSRHSTTWHGYARFYTISMYIIVKSHCFYYFNLVFFCIFIIIHIYTVRVHSFCLSVSSFGSGSRLTHKIYTHDLTRISVVLCCVCVCIPRKNEKQPIKLYVLYHLRSLSLYIKKFSRNSVSRNDNLFYTEATHLKWIMAENFQHLFLGIMMLKLRCLAILWKQMFHVNMHNNNNNNKLLLLLFFEWSFCALLFVTLNPLIAGLYVISLLIFYFFP